MYLLLTVHTRHVAVIYVGSCCDERLESSKSIVPFGDYVHIVLDRTHRDTCSAEVTHATVELKTSVWGGVRIDTRMENCSVLKVLPRKLIHRNAVCKVLAAQRQCRIKSQ